MEAEGRLRIRMEGCCVNAAWGGRCVEGDLVRMSAGIGCWVLVFLEEGKDVGGDEVGLDVRVFPYLLVCFF